MQRTRKVITESQAEAILQQREELALQELRELGFRIGLYEPRKFVEADPLRGIAGGWQTGSCYVIAESTTGKRKTVSAMSAVDALDQVKAWLHYVETRIAPEMRFVIAKGGQAVPVIHRVSGDTAQTEQRRRETERKLISFASGTAEVVDAHGAPINGAITQASQYAATEGESPE